MDQFNELELRIIRHALDKENVLSFGLNKGVNDLICKVNKMIYEQERKLNKGEWKKE